jgi:beta-lactamase regulating signal transducer with metallopeptidase domain
MSALLLEVALKSSLVLAVAAGLDLMLRRRGSAATRHLLWTIALGSLLVLPVLLASMPRWELRVPIASGAQPIGLRAQASDSGAGPGMRPTSAVSSEASAVTPAVAPREDKLSFGLIAILTYAAGVALLLVRLGLQQRAARRLVHASTDILGADWVSLLRECAECLDINMRVRLVRTCDHTVPMTFGTRVPTIVVPAAADAWSDERRKAVLLHELAHIVRRDCAIQMAAAVACAMYWCHPGVWWAAHRMRREREIACDDRVVAAGTQPTEYAGHLLELAYTCMGSGAPALAVSMARPSEIEGRLRAILDAARNRRTLPRRTRMWMAVTAVIAIAIVAAARATLVPIHAQSERSSANRLGSSPSTTQRREHNAAARAIADGQSGTWQMWISEDGTTRLRLSDRDGSTYSLGDDGHALGQWHTSNGNAVGTMTLTRDAGTFALEGVFKPGAKKSAVAAGTFTFAPSATFPADMAKRGYARPTVLEQYLLARSDIGFTFFDEMSRQGYARPDLETLVRASEHGVTLSHLRTMGQLGYRLQRIEALVTQIDHGVSPDFVRELREAGFTNVSADDLVRTRDHGVDAAYIKDMKVQGFDIRSLDEAIRTRDHGVDVEYVRGLRQLGFRLTPEETIRARDHGVDLEYIRELAGLGYAKLPLTELIRTRDHAYIRALAAQGYKGLSVEQLIRLRDHGVDPEFVKTIRRSGLSPSADDLVRLRDAGPIADRLVDNLRKTLAQWSARFAMWRGRLLAL